ncbi:winged helix-turn-helix domain-containing protein [Antribacter gilvus]|uniref:winged helix-turn-helix domain-containing protein n=1 Tax=Antribacter gilvus TaxID=2304675 RepID=UPI000F78883C|nr:helix-turn-helix domain-containing protein [Antribacter gilvus]
MSTDPERPAARRLGDAIREKVADTVAEVRAGVAEGGVDGLAETLSGLGDQIGAAVDDAVREAVGPSALKGLAHPLRVKILDLLGSHGPLTASGLGELLGESSGSTSYHLRQLAKHGFVREVEGKGTARERWWERPPGRFSISDPRDPEDHAGRETAYLVNAEFERARQDKIWALLRSGDRLPEEWHHVGTLSTANLRATPEQLTRVIEAWEDFHQEHLEPLRAQGDNPEARPVQVHFNAFPLLDPTEDAR